MTAHPGDGTLVRFVDGDLTENDGAALRSHLPDCPACSTRVAALRDVISTLATPALPIDSEAEAAAVLRRIRTSAPEPRSWRAAWMWASGGLVAAAALLFFVRAVPNHSSEFTARGGASTGSELSRKVGVDLDVSVASNAVRITGAYRNLLDHAAHALVFAIDSHDEIHWIYPAFTDDKQDPSAVMLTARTSDAHFADGAVVDAPPAGTLRLVTVVSPSPMHVSQIEHLDRAARSLDGLRKRFAACDISERSVEIK